MSQDTWHRAHILHPETPQISRDQPELADCAQDKGWAPTAAQVDPDTNGEAVSLIIKSTGRSPRLPGFVAWLYELG